MILKRNLYSLCARLFAASASLFGKLSGNQAINIYISIVFIATMIIFNACMWTFYSKALNLSSTSITPTVISASSNYIISGILGILIFNESTSLLWWSGMSFILIGLFLITSGK